MSHARPPCPLDSSRLVEMGLSYGAKGVDLSIWYCPSCDVAFVLLSPAGSDAAPSVLQWHRRGGQLELREQDRQRWGELPRQFRDAWESNVRHHVREFLGRRHSERVRCRRDGSLTLVVHRWRDEAGTGWLMSWCVWCKANFLFASSAEYGWECCACVAWNGSQGLYEVWKEYPTDAGHTLSPQLVAGLPPLADYTLDDFRGQLRMFRQHERQALPPVILLKFPWAAKRVAAEFDRVERIIEAMTPEERRDPDGIEMPRRYEIAQASTTRLPQVCEFFTHFAQVREVMCRMGPNALSP
jgi:hypothetical protein